MRLPLYQVDAFTDRLFGGNPAAIVPLERWLPDQTMQAIAAENNLAETAFFVPEGEAYALRWFTPTVEVDLCGHATLASAHVIFRFVDPRLQQVDFRTLKAGMLRVTRQGEALVMDFPAWPPEPCPVPPELPTALGRAPEDMLRYRQRYLAVFEDRAAVAALTPDFCRAAPPGLRRPHRHRARQRWRRFRLALFRARPWHRRGSGDRLGALRADALLGETSRQDTARGSADLAPRRHIDLHARRRSRCHDRPLRALPRRHDHRLGATARLGYRGRR